MKKIGIALAIILIAGSIYLYQNTKGDKVVQESKELPGQSSVRTYTMEEVAQHGAEPLDENANPDSYSCWVVIHDKVYDVTNFLDSHPGGEAIYEGCGTDATILFETRPQGSSTPHSATARSLLEQYYIGDLKK